MVYPIVLSKGPFSILSPGLKAIYAEGKWWFHVQSLMSYMGYSTTYIANVQMICTRLPQGSYRFLRRASKPTFGTKDAYADFDGWQSILRGGKKVIDDRLIALYLEAKKAMSGCTDDNPELDSQYVLVAPDA